MIARAWGISPAQLQDVTLAEYVAMIELLDAERVAIEQANRNRR